MAIEDALADVADMLTYCPVTVIQDALDCAPILYDKNTGRLSPLLDFDSADANIAMTRGEARTLVEMCADFAIAGYASNGEGDGVPVPLTVYEERTKFRDRFPRLYRGLRIAGLAISALSLIGLPLVAGVAAAEGPDREGEVQTTVYLTGKDQNSTLDDKMQFALTGGCHWYWISTTSDPENGVNMTRINETMESGSGIAFDYDKNTGDECNEKVPYKVTKIYWIKDPDVYGQMLDKKEHDKKIEDETYWADAKKTGGTIILVAATIGSGFITLIVATNIPEHLRKKKAARRNKNK